MLGSYENFPDFPHALATFTCVASARTLQEAIIKTVSDLNSQEFDSDAITATKLPNCKISFEFGIAEGTAFNYLNPEETDRFRKNLAKEETVLNIDLLCIIKYHQRSDNKRKPLKFDYHMLRFIFRKPEAQLRIFHERGTQRLSIEELTEFLTKQINNQLEKTQTKPLHLRAIMHPVPIESL